jgi:predicted dehydrogenase
MQTGTSQAVECSSISDISVDTAVELFGTNINVAHATLMKTRFKAPSYDVDDSAFLNLQCKSNLSIDGAVDTNIVLSRVAGREEDSMNIVGEYGVVELVAEYFSTAATSIVLILKQLKECC